MMNKIKGIVQKHPRIYGALGVLACVGAVCGVMLLLPHEDVDLDEVAESVTE